MKHFFPLLFGFLSLAQVFVSCGENLAGPGSESLSPLSPRNLKALSISSSSVQLSWSPPGGANNSVLLGYVIRWAGKEDSVGTSTVSYRADSLDPGATQFSVFSRLVTRELSDSVTIRWAPAARFDTAFPLYEYSLQNPARSSGLQVGGRSGNPVSLPVDPEQASIDFFLFGGYGQIPQSLSLWSARMFASDFKPTKFSSVTSHSPTLDFPLQTFPDTATFTKDTIAVADSTIYYLQLSGNNQEVNYARVLVRLRPGTVFPDRIAEVRVSFQKVPGVPFAHNIEMIPGELCPGGTSHLRTRDLT